MKSYIYTKIVLLSALSFLFLPNIYAKDGLSKDTLYTELKKDIVILSSTKETNSLKSLPAAVSVFSPKNLEGLQVYSLKDLSSIVPNYFAADYGSKMTSPLYIRGIGARSGDQTVSMYVDNVPYFNTTSFDAELFDIQRVEVLRGTQGTLYGRNAMGGIINIYTFSPLNYEGTTIKVGGGSHGQLSGNASHYRRLGSKMGVSIGAYYKQDDGYFTNQYNGKKVDDLKNGGGRAKFAWEITPRFSATYSVSFDYVDQGAFPYANIETTEIDYNSDSYYKRKLLTNGLALRYAGKGYEINSTTGYQYLNDDMNMDQDYTPKSYFQINQRQRQNSISQEVTIKSTSKSRYQWSFGGYGFYDYLHTTSPVYMMEDGIAQYLQKPLDNAHAGNPMMPEIKFTDNVIDLNSNFRRPIYGAAAFHQSTFNDLFATPGLSVTLGLRLDYEKTELKYYSDALANYTIKPQGSPVAIPQVAKALLEGRSSDDFLELLPKGVIKYQINPASHLYVSASRGYKAGGNNIQIFADLLQEALEGAMRQSEMTEEQVNSRIAYKPEYSWNYELGGQADIISNTLSTNFALYYIDVRDVQITQFINNRGGRMVSNAGKAVSKGFEVGLKARPCNGFYLYANYGFADARFKDYLVKDGEGDIVENYTNNHIPFAPGFTFSVGGSISYDFKHKTILDRFTFDTNFSGVGKIYWAEDNEMSQGFYGTLNAHLALEKSIFTLEFWGKNILDRDYNAFLFESMGSYYAQKSKPARWGASLKIKL
ncbi:iron complex outermembrane receptor protein [Dysgonomonas sp. PFB1-18]|uniref:TonB-dependent receptor n=1 Tax=unclassified Dysgonomonas TaxID=2630389 RepID=UPI00247577FA|nr:MULTISPECIES: TonB-dependent receptor [unclassified Dysgonomonas]MDH6310714.1 iron complex outermembrane receptor protein [Dysgonomonas sp. PF1-14]MDH6340565.1 iron complex outermembrane receptor protein [Dysgonomonas sp. PF1-16]MDH6382179.1 iron complex outermembrane receptor protein [Dysgonomonas sp. PFB1-18]MDH6399522.1 iron complex outermembrane receptor protein [Dysgonomonas sp. PF1-23]